MLGRDFDRLWARLEKLCAVQTVGAAVKSRRGVRSPSYRHMTSQMAVALLRSLESASTEALALRSRGTSLNADRLKLEVDGFRVAVEGAVLARSASTDDDPLGSLAKKLGGVLNQTAYVTNYLLIALEGGNYCGALAFLNGARESFLGAMADIRVLYEAKLRPSEERAQLRRALREAGMGSEADRLETAESEEISNAQNCIGNCREVLDNLVGNLAKSKLGTATLSFAGRLAELRKSPGFITQEQEKLLIDLYSYLSSKWKSGTKPKPSDAGFALNQTYFFVDLLLVTASSS